MLLVRSVDCMSRSKDTIMSQLSYDSIYLLALSLSELGLTHIAISCPLDDENDYPGEKPVVRYLEKWVSAIRSVGLNVWYRNTWNSFEGNYSFTHKYPSSSPSQVTGVAEAVLNGSDTTSYLYKTYKFIKDNPSLFVSGDLIGFLPEPENQGVGADLSVNMWSSYSQLGQFLVDLKTVCDAALSDIGVSGVVTGMTSVNGGTIRLNHIGSSYWSQIGKAVIDHYRSYSDYSLSLDTIYANAGVDIYIGEWGSTSYSGGAIDDSYRYDNIHKFIEVFKSKEYIKGFNYWQAATSSETKESILLPDTFKKNSSAYLLKRYFTGQKRVQI